MILRYNNLSIEEEKKILLELWRDYKSRQSEDEGDAITPETLEALLAESPTISGKANSADLSSVATSGSYDDLLDKPTIPTVPTNVSDFVNDANSVSEVPIINHGTSDTTFTLPPNEMHVWGTVTTLAITLGTATPGLYNEYMFEFSCGATAATLTVNSSSTIKWPEEPVVEAYTTYQVSIVDGIALIVGV